MHKFTMSRFCSNWPFNYSWSIIQSNINHWWIDGRTSISYFTGNVQIIPFSQ